MTGRLVSLFLGKKFCCFFDLFFLPLFCFQPVIYTLCDFNIHFIVNYFNSFGSKIIQNENFWRFHEKKSMLTSFMIKHLVHIESREWMGGHWTLRGRDWQICLGFCILLTQNGTGCSNFHHYSYFHSLHSLEHHINIFHFY